ncbi:MAG: hypothetical protein H6601_04120 [Flavobacteriales bacterium]|nr:hypothetical protein [Flavobacteriales bacterium]
MSGIIAFILAALTMWFWYLPNHPSSNDEMNQAPTDSVLVQDTLELN